jgi:hypothetical protein
MQNAALPYWPLMLMVATYVGYQVMLKLPTAGVNALAFQTFAYFAAFVIAAGVWVTNRDLGSNKLPLRDMGIAIVFGAIVVALEFGYISAYRLGWPVNLTGTMVNVITAMVMIPIGFALFREGLSLINAAGLVLCCVGLAMLAVR